MKSLFGLLLASLFFLSAVTPSWAAEFYADTNLRFTEDDSLTNPYLAGDSVLVETDVVNDLVVAGNTVEVSGNVSDGILAAAGELMISGTVGDSVRAAGSEVRILGEVDEDVVLFANEAVIGSDATVGGDVVFFGASLHIEGQVDGRVILNCACDVEITGEVGGVEAEQVGELRLSSTAVVDGPLKYRSYDQAIIDRGAVVNGTTDFTKITQQSLFDQANNFLFFYGLIASFIFALLLLLLFGRVVSTSIATLQHNVVLTFGIGLAVMVLLPIVSFGLMIVSFWAGLAGLLLYGLLLVTAYALSQLLLGWWLLYWWMGRSGQEYEIDWRAALIGVLTATILTYVPVLGWFLLFFAMVLALGGLGTGLWKLRGVK